MEEPVVPVVGAEGVDMAMGTAGKDDDQELQYQRDREAGLIICKRTIETLSLIR